MMFSREQTIAGRPAVELREAMRRLRGRSYMVLGWAEDRRTGEHEARRLIEDLVAEGLVERAEHLGISVVGTAEDGLPSDALDFYTTTIAGNALAKARIGKRMERSEAERLLQGVVERAATVNENDGWLHWVRAVVLYGSLVADGNDPVGDVDVAVVIEPRFDGSAHDERQERMIEQDEARPRSIIDGMGMARGHPLSLADGGPAASTQQRHRDSQRPDIVRTVLSSLSLLGKRRPRRCGGARA